MSTVEEKLGQEITYALRRGVSIGGVKPDVIGSELTRIHKEDGELTTKGVVNAARPEEAPLHPAFEWRNDIAAENYREYQARSLIRSVEIVQNDDEGKPENVTAFVHVPSQTSTQKSGTYEPIGAIVLQPDKFVIALSEAQSRVNSAKVALDQLVRAAEQSDISKDRMAVLSIAAMAMQTAKDAVSRVH